MNNNLDASETAKILVWKEIGNEFKQKNTKRIFAIALKNPKYFLFTLYNQEMDILIRELVENPENADLILMQVNELNEIHNMFSELNEYLTQSNDMLSTGSFLTSKIKSENRLAGIINNED